MSKIELKELAPYIPYELKAIDIRTKEIRTVTWTHFTYDLKYVGMNHLLCQGLIIAEHKPILRPLSDLSQIELLTAGFNSHIDYLTHELQNKANESRIGGDGKKLWRVEAAPYEMVVYLLKNHFDVFGLIRQGLAIDINSLKTTKP